MPVFSTDEHVSAYGFHPLSVGGNRASAFLKLTRAARARSTLLPSHLLIAIPSAISIIPRLIPCSSSPVPVTCSSRKKSTIECAAVSDCPTPTVSTSMVSNPAASHSTIVSRVLRATPPSEPADGLGRMNALAAVDSSFIRVLSPSILPFERSDEGSMASTAKWLPCLHRCVPSASINVDLPAPGTPVMPTRMELPENGRHASITFCAIA